MSLYNDQIQLQPLVGSASMEQASLLHAAWEELAYQSVEAISANRAALEDFADECVYIATILEKVPSDTPADIPDVGRMDTGYDEEHHRLNDVGIIYLQTSSLPGTFDIGIALCPEAQGRGIGPQALRLAVGWAFGELNCHRVQARIIRTDAEWTHFAMGVFLGVGFSFDGTSRRALFCPVNPSSPYPDGSNGEWRDVTHLSILDTDWVMLHSRPPAPSSVLKRRWEELFAQEERDREELLRWEEWEEKRKREKRNRTPTVEASGPPVVLPETASWGIPCSPPIYPFSSEDAICKGKEPARSDERALSQLIEAALSDMARFSPQPAVGVDDNEDLDWHTPREPGTPVYASGSRSPSFIHDFVLPSDQREWGVPSGAHSPAFSFSTPSTPLLNHAMDDDDDPFSDIASIGRSASVVSNSDHWDGEAWDVVETSSSGSSVSWSESEDEP